MSKGVILTYNGTLEWNNAPGSAGGDWGTVELNNYIYGSNCDMPLLDPPADMVIGEGNVLTFTPDANAGSTTVYILLGENILMTINNFVSGTAVDFPVNGTFTIKARSITGSSDYLNSEMTAEGPQLIVAIPNQTITEVSNYCEEFRGVQGGQAGEITYSVETINNEIVVTIHNDVWRTGGVNIAGWRIGTTNISTLLEKVSPNNTGSTQVFRIKEGISIPKGTQISYVSGGGADWEWGTASWLNAGTPIANYVYGSICGELPDPVVFDEITPSTNGNGICWTVNEAVLSEIDKFEVWKKEPASASHGGDLDFVRHSTIERPFMVDGFEVEGSTFCYDFSSKLLRAGEVEVEAYVVAFIDDVEYQSETIGNVPMIPTGILTPSVGKDAVKTQYFTIDGRQITEPVMGGIYLVKKTYEDGSVVTEKVFRK